MKKTIIKQVLLWSVFLTVIASQLLAVTTGKITGIVKDSETGEAMAGVNVLITGTSMGGATDFDGRYFILNVPVGTWDLRASYIGFKDMTITGVLVTIDHTITMNFDLETEAIEGEEVTVTAERKLIQLDNTATKTFISASDITSVPSESFTDLVALEAGAVGMSVRGGRSSGTIFYIDGVSMRNPMTGYGPGQTGTQTNSTNVAQAGSPNTDGSLNVDMPEFAFEEIEMLTGGYSPEYGNAQDAVINIATTEGRDKHTGRFRITDEGGLMSSFNETFDREWYIDPDLVIAPDTVLNNSAGEEVNIKGGRIVINGIERDAEAIAAIKEASEGVYHDGNLVSYSDSEPIWVDTRGDYRRNKYSFAFSGPLTKSAFYSFSGEYLDQAQGHFNNQDRTNYSILGKLTYHFTPQTKLNFSYLKGNQSYKLYDFEYAKYNTNAYLPGYGSLPPLLSILPERFKTTDIITAVLNHSLNPNSYLTLTIGQYNSTYDQMYRDYDDRDADGDTDEFVKIKNMTVKSGHPDSTSGPYEYAESTELRATFNDDGLVYIWTMDPSITDTSSAEYNENYLGEWRIGNMDIMSDPDNPDNHLWTENNPVGWKEIWTAEYDPSTEEWNWISDWLFVNGDNQIEETGVFHPEYDEGTLYNVSDALWKTYGDGYGHVESYSKVTTLKLDYSNQIHPIHFIQLGGEYLRYNMSMFNARIFSLSNYYLDDWHQKPTEWGFYMRDKIEMGGLIVNAGLRFDSYNLHDLEYSGDALDPESTPVDAESGEVKNPVKWSEEIGQTVYISPRLGISHPITDRDVLHFSYNHFLQRPDWRYFFENIGYSTEGAYEQIGNPELEPQRTISYEVGFTHQFSANVKVDVTGFYKDIFGWVQQSQINNLAGTRFWIYENADWGSAKGFEVALDKRMSNNFSADVNYTYLITKGRLSDPQMGGTYLWRNLIAPTDPHAMDHDQTHTLSIKVGYYIPPTRNPLLGDWMFNIINKYGSGFPYDTQDRGSATTVPAENDGRLPATFQTDLRVQKRFTVSKVKFSTFLEVYNVFNYENMVYSPEGVPYSSDWYESDEDRDGNGVADHYQDPEGRYRDWTVWSEPRHAKLGVEINF